MSSVSDFGISSDEAPVGAAPTESGHRVELARQLRRLVRATVAAPLGDEILEEAAASLRLVADRIEHDAGAQRRPRHQPNPDGAPQDFFPTSPVIGVANPLAPPVELWAEGRELHGRAVFDDQYEGPPNCVHGGVIAEVFDEILGAVGILNRSAGMTGTLTVRYRSPTPIRAEIRVRGAVADHQGRKITIVGTMHHGETLTAEAEGIFIQLGPDRFLKALGRAGAAAGARERFGEGDWPPGETASASPSEAVSPGDHPSGGGAS